MRIVQTSDKFLRKLKKFRSDKSILEGYLGIVTELELTRDPAKLGERKHGIYRNCNAIHITKNHGILYRYLPDRDLVQLIDLDDHKNLYGRDNRA